MTWPSALVYVTRNVKAEKNLYIIDKGDLGYKEDLDVKQDSRVTEDLEEEVDLGYALEVEEDLTNNPLNAA